MNTFPIGYRVAQAIGFTGAAWLSGNIAALSMNAAPALIRARKEDHLPITNTVKLWRNLFESGKSQNPPIAALTASSFFYLAWSTRSSSTLFRQVAPNSTILYGTAAILTLGIVPYTIVAMSGTNNALLAKTKLDYEPSSQASAEIEELVNNWALLNGFRSLLPLAGGLLGIFAALA
ncbi:uncharacterized protein TRUGW13939_10033 [Talaromyces rugulosus]|uniref:DUF1772 domain-containing protein n=1 Tax=Talaromyces rugulosus TaxID=121627 RepID=A0A7H8RA81_TALRU|nr:uncharacterized protein TRUGW13939_10033 [Talaromyces rugulosus]QKX62868.1 hypothetical protein TRUGW13939_10033 [Talaromyces rugulosus]